jgi:hypothetical protein
MRRTVETLGGLLILGGAAGIVRRFLGWAPFGIVVRAARATPFVRDHEVVAYVALIVIGVIVLVAADKIGGPGDGASASS